MAKSFSQQFDEAFRGIAPPHVVRRAHEEPGLDTEFGAYDYGSATDRASLPWNRVPSPLPPSVSGAQIIEAMLKAFAAKNYRRPANDNG